MNVKTKVFAIALSAISAFSAPVANAQEVTSQGKNYIVVANGQTTEASEELISAMRITVLRTWVEDNRTFEVLSAPNEGYLGAYLYARSVEPVDVQQLPQRWTGSDFAALPANAWPQFSQPVAF